MTSQLRRGDLRLVTPPDGPLDGSRLAVVLGVGTSARFVEIALVHPYGELSTSLDGIVPGALAGTPYDVVVQADLRGVVWLRQVSRLVARLADGTLEEISDLIASGRAESPVGVRTGTPLVGRYDRRWSFKSDEGRALDRLTSHCTGGLIGGNLW